MTDNKDKKADYYPTNYLSLINEVIAAKKSRTGVSRQAIVKHIEQHYPAVYNSPAFKRSFRSALARGLKKQMLIAVTASTYKNSEKAKKELIAAAKPKKVAPTAKKADTTKKAADAKKTKKAPAAASKKQDTKAAAKPKAKPSKAAAKPKAKAAGKR